jgi:NTP pyrophosphatase (non-canonical NTP hydrolase)
MNLKNEMQPIRNWAEEKGIYKKGDLKTQTLKLIEESGELAKAILNNDKAEVIDAIGDCVVVLTSIANLASKHFEEDITIEECINIAYFVISKRKGKMENGTFVKNKENG